MSAHSDSHSARGSPRLGLGAMRLLALSLLILMMALFLLGRLLEDRHVGFGYLVAFAEAATVGALADWFAVTALFRRPLGLPIPHTAIIPRSKDRIGQGLGRFLEQNFLDPATLQAQLARADLAGVAARWLAAPGGRGLVARSIAGAAPQLLELANDPEIERAIGKFVEDRFRGLDAATLLANVLETMTAQGRHQPLIERAVAAADRFLQENEADLRRRVREETSWLWRLFAVDRKASDALITAVQTAIRDMAEDPESSWRVRVDEALASLVGRLRDDPALRLEVDAGKRSLLDQPEISSYFSAVWRDFKREMSENASSRMRELAPRIDAGLAGAARAISEDATLREAINERLREWIMLVAKGRREDVARFVAETIRGWDARTVIDRIEAGVGPDLQYIRISGTLIGGLVGVVLHTVSLALPS